MPIGSGETAASVVISLLGKLPRGSSVDVLTSCGVLYSRGESYEENRLYSDPGDWPGLAEAHRPGRLLAAGRGDPQRLPRVPCTARDGGGGRSRACERLAARAEQRGLSFSDLLVEYAQDGLARDGADGP